MSTVLSCKRLFGMTMLWAAMLGSCFGNSASPFPVVVAQPTGEKVTLFLRGNEKLNWYEYVPEAKDTPRSTAMSAAQAKKAATPGYTVVQAEDGTYVFAELDGSGNLSASSRVVGKDDPEGPRRIMPPKASIEQMAIKRLPEANIPSRAATPSGPVKNLVVLLRFADHANRSLPPKSEFETLFNSPQPVPGIAPTGSVNAFYRENSYGKLDLQSTVIDWLTLPKSEAYYADGQSGLSSRIREAIRDGLNLVAASGAVDLKDFDNENGGTGDGWIDAITFVHSGYAAEFGGAAGGADSKDRIWSHRWSISPWSDPTSGVKVSDYNINPGVWGVSGNSIGRIGVICHELGHFFGLPDLYDYSGTGEGAGSWCLMANSWGFDGTQLHPPHMSAWCKISLNWNQATPITGAGKYSLAPTTAANAKIYRIDYPSATGSEYLLIENRQSEGEFDGGIPAGTGGRGGLAIWHIDDLMPENDRPGYPGSANYPQDHYKVGLLQADGAWELERHVNRGEGNDLFRKGHVDSISSTTNPSSTSFSGETLPVITQISESGLTMSFQFGDEVPEDSDDTKSDGIFTRQIRILEPVSHVSNFSEDGKAATIIFDRLTSFVYQADQFHSQSAKLQVPMAKGSGDSKVRVMIRGYANIADQTAGTVIVAGLGQPLVFNPLDHATESSAPAVRKQGAKKAFAQKRSLGMPPRPSASEGKDYLFETVMQVPEEAGLMLHLILMSNKSTRGDEGAYITIDSIDLEIADK